VPQHGVPTQPGGYPPPPPPVFYPAPPQGGYAAPPQGGYAAPPQTYAQPGYPYPHQVPVSPGGHRLAEFSDRFLARLIDGLILGVAASILIVPLYLVAFFLFLNNAISTTTTVNGQVIAEPQNMGAFFLGLFGLVLCVLGLTFVMQYIYEVEMMFRTGQTIGKKAMKIRVLPVDPTVALTRKMAFKRFLVNIAAGFVPGLGWVDGLWQLWDKPWRQCLHDKFAQTLVIKLNP
jgi:uncharacterized RDD family membrane protein YckC